MRDDYTAFSLATIGYVMLHTTALSLDDGESPSGRQHFLTTPMRRRLPPSCLPR
jgi:hypothetical protein